MSYNWTNCATVTVRTNMSNWLNDDPPSHFKSTLRNEGNQVATRDRLLDDADGLSDEIKKSEAIKHACYMINNTSEGDDVIAEMSDMARQVAPFKATEIECKVSASPIKGSRGAWDASLEVSYTDSLGKKVTSSLPFRRIVWDKWHVSEADLEYASSLPLTNKSLGSCFRLSCESLSRPSDVASAAIHALADSEGCSVSRNGSTWTVSTPDGSDCSLTSAIASRFRRSLQNFCPTWSVDVSTSVPNVNDLEYLCGKVNEMLDHADQEVQEIDNEGYEDYGTYAYKRNTADRLTRILEQSSKFKEAISDLGERLDKTHARLSQVMDNAHSVAHGTTSHLFD